VEDLESEAERRLEPHRDLRFRRAARGVEDVRDVDLRLRGHAPQDARDERPVSAVGQDRAVRLPRVGLAVDAGQPREGLRRARHQTGVGLVDPHPGAAIPADRGVGSRRRVNLLWLRGRTGMHYLRGGQHMIRRRGPRAEFGVDAVEQVEHIGPPTVSGPAVAFRGPGSGSVLAASRVQVDEHDIVDHSPDGSLLDPVGLPEYIQYSSLPPGVLNSLDSVRSVFPAEILLAGEDAVLGVHEGNAAGVQVVVFFGVVGEAADFDRDVAVAERVDNDLGLRNGPSLKRRLKRAVPVIVLCHCALRN
jgi:hypothetical protein